MTTLAFALAATIKHDGHGGITDLLATPAEAVTWLRDHDPLLKEVLEPLPAPDPGRLLSPIRAEILPTLDGAEVRAALVRVRGAVRALFARAVAPQPPSKADADRLMDVDAALRIVNDAAGQLGTTYLVWDDEPRVQWAYRTDDPVELLVAAVGRSTIDFLTGPDRARLRACPAARCVKYFLQDDPRQTWCSPACGNRERVNRHYRRRVGG
jgi:predicted RNA-binding Zn ribbon-like protein